MTNPLPEVENETATKHAATLKALAASPWCRGISTPKSTVAIFLSPKALRRLKRAVGR